jgi:hypothetical protein
VDIPGQIPGQFPGLIIGYRKDGRPIRRVAGGAFNATVVEASDLGLGAWTADPAAGITSGSFAAATQYLAAFFWKAEADVAPFPSLVLMPNVIVGSWTLVQFGIICQDQVGQNAPGTLLASSTATLPTAGITTQALAAAATAPAALPQGRYWLSLVITGTTGTALSTANPLAASLGNNLGTDTNHMRFATNGTTIASITPASNVAAGATLCLVAGIR